jgi:hypothetical protein
MMTSCPFRVTLGLFRATLASWGKNVRHSWASGTCHLAHNCLPKPPKALDDVMGVLGDVTVLPRPTSSWKGHNPLGMGLPSCLWWNILLFLRCNPLICLCPLSGFQRPSGGLLAPWRFKLIISHVYLSISVPLHRVCCRPYTHLQT